jgi:hypothetical protein
MTKEFAKWADRHGLTITDLADAFKEVAGGNFEADLGGHVLKKQVPFPGQGKRGSGRTIICFKKDDRAIFVHGFAKNEKANISKKELTAFRRVTEILLNLSPEQITRSISTGTFFEVDTDEKDNG